MKIIDHKDAIYRRLYKGLIIVKTAIYRVSCPNRTVLKDVPAERLYEDLVFNWVLPIKTFVRQVVP
jgi:hypothetical protein